MNMNISESALTRKEVIEEKEAMTKFGSKDSGASLGDILGKVLGKKNKIIK